MGGLLYAWNLSVHLLLEDGLKSSYPWLSIEGIKLNIIPVSFT